jgi:diguanylate cyclase (GGDEF)-like protein/PAS domain S-box-containing protein
MSHRSESDHAVFGPVVQPESPLIYLSTQFIRAKEYLEAIVVSSSDAIITTGLDGRIIYFSPGAERMSGWTSAAALGMPISRLYASGRSEAGQVMRRLLQEDSISDYETTLVAADGRRIAISMSASLLRGANGKIIGTLGISKDISRRVDLEKRLRELSMTDGLTGLRNQRDFHERAAAEVQRARRLRHSLSLLLIDLDRFKDANDLWGHLEGDRILRETAGILLKSIRKDVDGAFRYGGDEFIVLLPGMGRKNAEKVARRIRMYSAEMPYADLVTLSIGIAALRAEDQLTDLIRRADSSMYRMKGSKKRASAAGASKAFAAPGGRP